MKEPSSSVSGINTGVAELSAAKTLERKLLKLTVSEHDSVLVSMDSEVPWFEEVRLVVVITACM